MAHPQAAWRSWARFWRGAALGLFALTVLAVAALAWATQAAAAHLGACPGLAGDGPSRDCGEIMLLIPTVGVLGIFALLVYFIAGIVMQAVRRSSRR
ncbi:MAG: hypothetical protein R3C52_01550 [Hyphomonadaceae bacterium]